MGLTRDDLHAIGELMDGKLAPISTRLVTMQEDINDIKSDVGTLKSNVGTLKSDVGTLKEDVSVLKEDVGILKEEMAEVKDRLHRIEITQKNEVLPRIQLLLEGQNIIIDKLDRLGGINNQSGGQS